MLPTMDQVDEMLKKAGFSVGDRMSDDEPSRNFREFCGDILAGLLDAFSKLGREAADQKQKDEIELGFQFMVTMWQMIRHEPELLQRLEAEFISALEQADGRWATLLTDLWAHDYRKQPKPKSHDDGSGM